MIPSFLESEKLLFPSNFSIADSKERKNHLTNDINQPAWEREHRKDESLGCLFNFFSFSIRNVAYPMLFVTLNLTHNHVASKKRPKIYSHNTRRKA